MTQEQQVLAFLQEGNCFVNTNMANGTYLVSITKAATKQFVNRKLIIANE